MAFSNIGNKYLNKKHSIKSKQIIKEPYDKENHHKNNVLFKEMEHKAVSGVQKLSRVHLKDIQNKCMSSVQDNIKDAQKKVEFSSHEVVCNEIYKETVPPINIVSPIYRDSLPIIRSNFNRQRMDIEDLPPNNADMKYVSKKIHYDHLIIDDDMINFWNNNDDSLFFNEGNPFQNNGINNFDGKCTEQKNDEAKKNFESLTSVKCNNKLLISEWGKCTPANTHIPNINGIKLIHKYHGRCGLIKGKVTEKKTLLGEIEDNECINTRNTSVDCSLNQWVLSPIVFVERPKERNNEEYMKQLSAYKLPGVVTLDSKENYVFHQVLYSSKYFKYIIRHQFQKESKHQLSNNFLKKYSITDLNRSIVINWLIKLQTYMKTEHVLVYTAVRIMDRTIDSVHIPLNMLQLVALASFWISLKYHAVDQKEGKWMVRQSGGAYSVIELVKMEQMVFEINDFYVDAVDLSILVHYYVLNLELTNADMVAHCAHYLVDCSLLNSCFVYTLPSMMVAAAVFTSLHLLNQYNKKLWFKLSFYCGYYSADELLGIKKKILDIVKEVNNPMFQCREPYYKYCSRKYCGIAHIVLDALTLNYNP